MTHIKRILMTIMIILVISNILSACTTSGSNIISPETIAKQVGAHYGDPQAQVSSIKPDISVDPPHHPMYLMLIVGNFHKNDKTAYALSFSAQADEMHAWAICAYDQQRQVVWFDGDLTHPGSDTMQ